MLVKDLFENKHLLGWILNNNTIQIEDTTGITFRIQNTDILSYWIYSVNFKGCYKNLDCLFNSEFIQSRKYATIKTIYVNNKIYELDDVKEFYKEVLAA